MIQICNEQKNKYAFYNGQTLQQKNGKIIPKKSGLDWLQKYTILKGKRLV